VSVGNYKVLMKFLRACEDQSYYDGLLRFHHDHEQLIKKAKGSKKKHQAWEGGYVDHLVECLLIGETMYEGLAWLRDLPFEWHNVVKVIYFHDVEKIFKYSDLEPPRWEIHRAIVEDENKKFLYEHALPDVYDILFTEEELNALTHIHGEKDYGEERIIGRLGAFCHCCDMLSARMWYDKPTPEEM